MKVLKYLKRQLWLYMGYRWLLDLRVIESDVIEVVTLVKQGVIGYRVTVERILHLKEDIANYRKLYTKLSKRNANETWVSLTALDEILDSALDVSLIDAYEEAHLLDDRMNDPGAFNFLDCNWDFSNVTSVTDVFKGCNCNWDVSKVTNVTNVFKGCNCNCGFRCATDLTGAFEGCTSFNPLIHKWGASCMSNVDDVVDDVNKD